MSSDTTRPRLASTIVVVRDAPHGLEVLLLRRAEKGDHNSGAWVFPGGLVDAADRDSRPFCTGLSDEQASRLLGVDSGGLDHAVAALRECFEEAGLLFATDQHGRPVDLQGEAGLRLAAQRGRLNSGACSFADLCRDFGLRLRADDIFYIGHWLTPLGRAKRFDTRFFLAVQPEGQASVHDAVETVEQVWLTPRQALAAENTRRLMTPTRAMIEQLASFADTPALLAWARSPRQVERVLPRLATGSAGPNPILSTHPAWDEVGRLDPAGRGDTWCELRPGVPVALSPDVRRLTAPDARTSSYLVACAPDAWAVIDPGPCSEAHLDALVDAAPGPLRWICLTDDDAQQAQAAAALQARTGAQLLGPQAQNGAAPGPRLRALRGDGTMGYLLVAEGLLFIGGQPVAPSTQATHAIEWIAPRRGFLVHTPPAREEAP